MWSNWTYRVFDLADEKKKILKNTTNFGMGLKENWDLNDDECKYGKDFTKIKFDTDDNLPLNEPSSLHMLIILVRSVFEDESKFYNQIYLYECLYEL